MRFDILRRPVNVAVAHIVVIYQAQRLIKLTNDEIGEVLAESSALSGVVQQLDIINERLYLFVDGGKEAALEYLASAPDAQALGVALVVGL